MYKVLVAGGAGQIGSMLCKHLLHLKVEVICIDNFSNSNICSIQPLLNEKNFSLKNLNIANQAMESFKCDAIINCSIPTSPNYYLKNRSLIFQEAMRISMNLLDCAKQHKAKYMLVSSCEIYGNSKGPRCSENDIGKSDHLINRACFDEAVRAAETMAQITSEESNLDVVFPRLFNVYSPNFNLNDGRALPIFVKSAQANENIVIYGTGMARRSFSHIADIVDLISKLIFSNFSGPINLSSSETVTIVELANLIKDLTKSSSNIIFKKNLGEAAEKDLVPNLKIQKSIFPKKQFIKLRDGLAAAF